MAASKWEHRPSVHSFSLLHYSQALQGRYKDQLEATFPATTGYAYTSDEGVDHEQDHYPDNTPTHII
jgi:hypothetical protein